MNGTIKTIRWRYQSTERKQTSGEIQIKCQAADCVLKQLNIGC